MTVVKKKIEGDKKNIELIKLSEIKSGSLVVTGLYKGTITCKGENGEFLQHRFETEEGVIVGVSAGQLNFKLKDVDLDTLLEITYLGKEKFKNKEGKLVAGHNFDISELVEE